MKLRHLTTSALALILIAGCGDDSTGLEPDDLAGTWTATSMLFTSTADSTVTADLVVDDMAVLTLVLVGDATYTFTFVFPPDPTEDETEAGDYTVTGTNLNLSPTGTGSPETLAIARDGDTMTLTDANEMFDFDPQPPVNDEPATLVITLTRP